MIVVSVENAQNFHFHSFSGSFIFECNIGVKIVFLH